MRVAALSSVSVLGQSIIRLPIGSSLAVPGHVQLRIKSQCPAIRRPGQLFFITSAKGAARATVRVRNCFAPGPSGPRFARVPQKAGFVASLDLANSPSYMVSVWKSTGPPRHSAQYGCPTRNAFPSGGKKDADISGGPASGLRQGS